MAEQHTRTPSPPLREGTAPHLEISREDLGTTGAYDEVTKAGRAVSAGRKPPSTEDEAWEIVSTFDARLTDAERRMDRLLARLGIE